MKYSSRLLIVDDVADNIQVAMNILREDNYEFSFASNGHEALSLLQSQAFDLVLLDVMMPGMNGFEVCEQLPKCLPNQWIPVIFLTAKVDADSIAKGFEVGAVDYLAKPFHANELLARVRTHLDLYHAKELLKQHNLELRSKAKFERIRLLSELEENQKEMIYVLTELMESTSDETGKHIQRVSEYSRLLARYHDSLNDEDADLLLHAAPMHDIGKVTIPHDILHKPGPLTGEEFEVMKEHTTNAHQLLCCSERKILKAAAIIAHEHHEHWDGRGYPRALKGDEIHLYGRIVAVADVFDALTHKRCYKDAWAIDDAVDYMKAHKGTHFDPGMVDIFVEHSHEFAAIATG